ncbi:MAG: ribosome maturation factor RimP [Methylophagaceae bacterium]
MRMAISDQIEQLIETPIESLGYEVVGVEYIKNGQHTVLRVYIDSEQGVSIEDCERVSHQVSGILEVEDPINSAYSLEVSSPGFDRPLFKEKDFERFAGSEAKLAMKLPIQGRRNFRGILHGFSDGEILIEVDGEIYALPFTKLAKARLVA